MQLLVATGIILALDLIVVASAFFLGSPALATGMLVTSLIVFGSGFIWLVAREDYEIHFLHKKRVFPILLWSAALIYAFKKSDIKVGPAPEKLLEVGQLLGARYLIGVWIVSAIVIVVFVTMVSIFKQKGGES